MREGKNMPDSPDISRFRSAGRSGGHPPAPGKVDLFFARRGALFSGEKADFFHKNAASGSFLSQWN